MATKCVYCDSAAHIKCRVCNKPICYAHAWDFACGTDPRNYQIDNQTSQQIQAVRKLRFIGRDK